jgi:hypothetical protein
MQAPNPPQNPPQKTSVFAVLVEEFSDAELLQWLEVCLKLGTVGMRGYEATAAEMALQGRPHKAQRTHGTA